MINLPNRMAIDADKYQYILGSPVVRINSKTGKEEITLVKTSYHRTVAEAMSVAMRKELRNQVATNNITSIPEYINKMEELNNSFTQAISGLA